MKKLILTFLLILIVMPQIALARRGGEEESRIVPRGKYDFNVSGYLSEIRDDILFFNDHVVKINPGKIEAFDSLGRPVVFSSIEPPAFVKLVMTEDKDGNLSASAIKVMYFPKADRELGRKSVNSLKKLHSAATYNFKENRIAEYGEEEPPPIKDEDKTKEEEEEKKDPAESDRDKKRSGSGLQIERQ
ncbi:MAG: hypothetical protein ACLFSQ_01400 [Candidatus Zixiibacteriota bacterium]